MAELAAAYVSLLPTISKKKVIAQTKGAGEQAGKEYGREFTDGVNSSTKGGLRETSDEYVKESKESGEESGRQYSAGMLTKLKVGLAAGAVAVGLVLAQGIAGALEDEKLGDKTAASLALSDKQASRAGAVAGQLYAGAWGESMPDVTNAVESVISSIDGMGKASSKELHDVTATALDFATAFEVDVSDSARNAGILIKSGLAKDATDAFDLMTVSLQQVPKALRGEVTDATQEYSQFFADLGFTGSQAMGLLATATEDGQYGIDKMGDAVKEFTIRATDMSAATTSAYEAIGLDSTKTTNDLLAGGERARTAFQTIVEGVRGIKDPSEQATTALALFGTPLEDLGTNEIPQFLAQMDLTRAGLGDTSGAAADMGATLNDNFATALESAKRRARLFVSDGLTAMWQGFVTGEQAGNGAIGVLSGVGATVRQVTTWFQDNGDTVKAVASIVLGAATAWGIYTAVTTGIPALLAAVRAAQIALNVAMAANPIGLVVVAIGALVGALVWFFTQTELGRKIFAAAMAGIQVAAAAVVDWFKKYALPFFKILWVTWSTGWSLLWTGIKAVWNAVGRPVFEAVRTVATAVWSWLDGKVFKPAALGFRLLGLAWNHVWRTVISPMLSDLRDAFTSAWRWVDDKVLAPFKAGIQILAESFRPAVEMIGRQLAKIRASAARPVNFVIETVYMDGIKATWDKIAASVGLDLSLPSIKPIAYAAGGVLPGWTPGRDVHEFYSPTGGRLALSGGEAIMRPEFTRAVGGPAGVASLNAAAKAGQAFADGGVFGWAGDVWEDVKSAARNASRFLTDPAGTLADVIGDPMRSLLGQVGGGPLGQIVSQLPRQVLGSLIDRAKGLVAPAGGGPGGAMGWEAMWELVHGRFPGAQLHSAFRPGAVTALGTKSLHGLGRAIDVTPSMEIFNWLASVFPNATELIYSAAGNRQIAGGRRTTFGEPTRGDHWDHIHWAMRDGGVIPKVYDDGGWMPSGGLGVNTTSRPEAVLDPDESRALKAGLNRTPRQLVFNTTRVTTRDVLHALNIADLHDGAGVMA